MFTGQVLWEKDHQAAKSRIERLEKDAIIMNNCVLLILFHLTQIPDSQNDTLTVTEPTRKIFSK